MKTDRKLNSDFIFGLPVWQLPPSGWKFNSWDLIFSRSLDRVFLDDLWTKCLQTHCMSVSTTAESTDTSAKWIVRSS